MVGSDRAQIIDSLARHPFFAELAPESLATLAGAMRSRHWPQGSLIFARGDRADGLYVIEEGLVRLSLDSSDGRELTLRIGGPGEILGEIAVIDGGVRTTDAVAATAVSALVLDHAEFIRFVDAMPSLRWAVLNQLCARLRRTTDQLEAFALLPLETRLARLFVTLAMHPNAVAAGRSRSFELGISQREIAAMVGASRPRVNRVLVGWDEQGIVRKRGPRVVCALDQLAQMASVQLA